MRNKLKETLNKGIPVAVPEINRVFSPRIIEALAFLGFKCVWIDQEHSDLSYEKMSELLLACEAKGLDSVVRIAYTGYTSIIKPFELGAKGLVMPHCMNAGDAKKFVNMAKFKPLGLRGMGGGRDSNYGMDEIGSYIKEANEETLLIVMIEDREAVENIDEIASIEGIDVLYIGPGDLSQSYGVPGEMRHDIIINAIDKVAAASGIYGKSWGIPVKPGKDMQYMLEKGARFLCVANDIQALIKGYGEAYQEAVKILSAY